MEEVTIGESQKSLLDRMIEDIKNHKILAYAMVIALTANQAFDFIGKVYKVSEDIGVRHSDSFTISESRSTEELNRLFLERNWDRLYWSRVFLDRLRGHDEKKDFSFIFNQYVLSVGRWNASLMIMIRHIRETYGEDRSNEFEGSIASRIRHVENYIGILNKDFHGIEILSNDFQGVENGKLNESQKEDIQMDISNTLNDLYPDLYEFSFCFVKKGCVQYNHNKNPP